MSYDGSVLRSVTLELNNLLIGARIEKIYQINKDELLLNVRGNKGKYKLLLSAASNSPRVYLSEQQFENPKNPPTFCMLLRKHLEGFRILKFEQYEMDRILKISVLGKDELGDECEKFLFVEIMGKHSNIILTNKELKIIDSIKRVNSLMSRVREVLPGLMYEIKSISNKVNPLSINNFEEFFEIIDIDKNIKNSILNTFSGISPLLIREICYKALIEENRLVNSLNNREKEALFSSYLEIISLIKENNFNPILIKDQNKIIDFSSINLTMYPNSEKNNFENINYLLDNYYIEKSTSNLMEEKSQSILKLVKNYIDRENKKLEKQISEYNTSLDREKYKIYADLISSNIYNIKKSDKSIIVENFYDNMNKIEIPLDDKISGSANANKYYKKYSKLKNASIKLKSEIEKTKASIEYLKSALLNIQLSDSTSDIEEIKEELFEMNYLKKNKTQKKTSKMKFLEYYSSDGNKIYCGKNNKQNEYLTLKLASKSDMWFHVKDAPGSHVILKVEDSISDSSIKEAATIAAYNSSLSNSNNITVDYTTKKNVKRHPSNILGLVNYTEFNSINIKSSDFDIIDKLKQKP